MKQSFLFQKNEYVKGWGYLFDDIRKKKNAEYLTLLNYS